MQLVTLDDEHDGACNFCSRLLSVKVLGEVVDSLQECCILTTQTGNMFKSKAFIRPGCTSTVARR